MLGIELVTASGARFESTNLSSILHVGVCVSVFVDMMFQVHLFMYMLV